MRLENHTAVVSGGASGLGEATVRLLAENGANVLILDQDADKGTALQRELGEKVLFVQTDVRDAVQVESAIATAFAAFGGIHINVNCAGIALAKKVLSRNGIHSLEDFRKSVDINLIGTFNVLRICAGYMSRNEPGTDGERGVIINTASVAAYEGQIGQAAYAASKGGIVSMTLPLAREFATLGIRVTGIAPGLFFTPLFHGLPPDAVQSLEQQVPFPARLGKPEEYAALVKTILENVMLNGEVIRLDGAIRMAAR